MLYFLYNDDDGDEEEEEDGDDNGDDDYEIHNALSLLATDLKPQFPLMNVMAGY